MAFVYSTALINHLIKGYKFPNGPLAKNQFNMCKNQVQVCGSLLFAVTIFVMLVKMSDKFNLQCSWLARETNLKKQVNNCEKII